MHGETSQHLSPARSTRASLTPRAGWCGWGGGCNSPRSTTLDAKGALRVWKRSGCLPLLAGYRTRETGCGGFPLLLRSISSKLSMCRSPSPSVLWLLPRTGLSTSAFRCSQSPRSRSRSLFTFLPFPSSTHGRNASLSPFRVFAHRADLFLFLALDVRTRC
ncbi:hypothetical protein B0H13DRAFT_1206763 [Mycena leptocephala]|nr:hypothetical protein B0H13DRAFT_1206763 [Mycena leptocephala]